MACKVVVSILLEVDGCCSVNRMFVVKIKIILLFRPSRHTDNGFSAVELSKKKYARVILLKRRAGLKLQAAACRGAASRVYEQPAQIDLLSLKSWARDDCQHGIVNYQSS